MSDFLDTINRWTEETEQSIDDVLQNVVLMVGKSVVTLSPVKTGLFKGNWQLTIDGSANSSLIRRDPEGNSTLADIAAKANTFTAGQVAYIQNMVTYGYDLEYGYSNQAPEGIVRVTALKFAQIVEDAVRLHKNN
jgi:serine protease inhibitor